MSIELAIGTVDLGFGDSGKGATVDWLCRLFDADLVVKYSGGCQAAHNVFDNSGRHHTFSQFGAGTLTGVRTWLHRDFIVDIPAIIFESEHLRYDFNLNINHIISLLSIDERCLVTTPLHVAINMLHENARVARGEARHGSCARGIGVTREYALKHPEHALRIADFMQTDFGVVLSKMRHLYHYAAALLAHEYQDVVNKLDLHRALLDQSFCEYACEYLKNKFDFLLSAGLNLVNDDTDANARVVIGEGSQGILIDETYGTAPNNTWSDVTLNNFHDWLQIHASADTTRHYYGITRSYMARHGAGPLPTEYLKTTSPDYVLNQPNITDIHNNTGVYQGAVRYGALDLQLLAYAADVATGDRDIKLDGVIINHLDQLQYPYYICKYYENGSVLGTYKTYMSMPQDTAMRSPGEYVTQQIIAHAKPLYGTIGSGLELIRSVEDALGLEVAAVGYGPTHDKRETLVAVPLYDLFTEFGDMSASALCNTGT